MSDININQNEQAREAERAVLGGLMLETQRFDTVIQVIKENDFDGKDHQIIFQSMSELIEENKPLDPLTVSEKLDNKNSLNKDEDGVWFEPEEALFSERFGLQDISIILEKSIFFLKEEGKLFLEHSPSQAEKIASISEKIGYINLEQKKYLNKDIRVSILTK